MTEWLEPDGLGGFAMGTADGIRTRRYHALLLVATQPPDARMVLVADLEVFVETPAGRFALSSHRYPDGVLHPDGHTRLTDFNGEPWPRWEWTLPDARIACELVVERAPHATAAPRVALRWTRVAGTLTSLHVQPLLAGRDYHATHHENPAFRFEPELAGDCVTWKPYQGVPAIHCAANALYQHAPDWYRAFTLAEEAARGLDAVEDLASPGVFTYDLTSGAAAMVLSTAWLSGDASELAEQIFAAEEARRRTPDRAAMFLAYRGEARTILAGYPWFTDWGRDTFISLRGLCHDRRDEAGAILRAWAGTISRGMLPNRFDEQSAAPAYNSVDAALWYVIAADDYLRGGADPVVTDAIAAIVDGHLAGTRHGIRVDADGLLACGEPGVQLTWMDAMVGDRCVTPRIGKPVEIQALWINALTIARRFDEAARARASFERFWDPTRGHLHDVIDCDHILGRRDPTCRPNQLFAIGGLPEPVLTGERARAVVDHVERVLWTPVGPRTLDPADLRYVRRYAGAPSERDAAYHNGPVWPWLAGAFIEAWLRVHFDWGTARSKFLAPLLARFGDTCPELCDPEPPYAPAGCPFQAWTLAELMRLDRLLAPPAPR